MEELEVLHHAGLVAVPFVVALFVPRLVGITGPSVPGAFAAGAGFWLLVGVAASLDVSAPQVASLAFQTVAMALVLGGTGLVPPRPAFLLGLLTVGLLHALGALAGAPDPIELVRHLA